MAYFYTTSATNNWSTAGNWYNGTGGTGGALGYAPTASDDAIFDANSYNDNYIITIDASSTCKDFTMDKPTGAGKKVTLTGSYPNGLSIWGNLNLLGGTAGITMSFTGFIYMSATSGTKTIDSNGVSLPVYFYLWGNGGTFQLIRDLECSRSNGSFYRKYGTFNANGHKVTCTAGSLYGLGDTLPFTGTSSFYDLSLIPASGAKTNECQVTVDIAVTHTLTITAASAVNRILVRSDTIGTPCTIDITGTIGNSFSNVDFKDITMVTGGADLDLSAITGGSGNCGGNSGITFTTGANQYFYKASGNDNTSTAANWYLGTGGSGGAGRVPLPQDVAIYDNLSFGAAGMTLTQDMPRIPSTTFCGVDGIHPVANNPTWTTSTAASVFGSLTLAPNMTLTASTQTYTFEGRAAGMPVGGWTLTSAGKTWAKALVVNAVGGTYKLIDDTITSSVIQHGSGTIDAKTLNTNITCTLLQNINFVSKLLSFGSTTLTLTGTGDVFSVFINGGTFDAGTSTIKITDTSNTAISFRGSNQTYNKVWFSRGTSTASNTISGSNSFAELKDDGSEQHQFIVTAGTTQTGTTPDWFKVNGSTTGKEIILNSTTIGTYNLVNAGGGVVSCDYLDIYHSVATPLNSWYAGAHSINHQSTATAGSGWIFGTPPSASTIVTNRGRNRFKFTPVSQG